MQANYVQRLRLTFRKDGPTRFIGHLDLARTLERSLNRARIPMSYSQGFNQRPRMNLAAALPLGYTSECEMADIWLQEAMDPATAQAQMMAKMAPGIEIWRVEEIPLSEPALQMRIIAACYAVTLLDPIAPDELERRVAALLAADSLPRERRDKTYDLRPLLLDLAPAPPDGDLPRLTMRLALREGQTGRPDEVLAALDLDPLAARIHRAEIVLRPLEAAVG